jgi:hypothetical protein
MVPVADDPHLWLEDITGDDALDWVRRHNDPTLAEFCDERFEQMCAEALEARHRYAHPGMPPPRRLPVQLGATRRTPVGCGAARHWTATAATHPNGMW